MCECASEGGCVGGCEWRQVPRINVEDIVIFLFGICDSPNGLVIVNDFAFGKEYQNHSL